MISRKKGSVTILFTLILSMLMIIIMAQAQEQTKESGSK
jgi:hypothetical protein